MRCLICNENFNVEALKINCQCYHPINKINYFLRELFSPDCNSKRCHECQVQFKNNRQKKNHNFLINKYKPTGGAINQELPVNISKRWLITYHSINFYQHKDFYDFYDEKIVDRFFNSVKEAFVSEGKKLKMQGYLELKNYQQTEPVELKNIRV